MTKWKALAISVAMGGVAFAATAAYFLLGYSSDGGGEAPHASWLEANRLKKTLDARELEFDYSSCKKSYFPRPATPPGEPEIRVPAPVEITRKEWIADSTLEVNASVLSACGIQTMKGAYDIDGGQLTLAFLRPAAAPASCGGCQYDLRYRLRGIKKQDYAIAIKTVELEQ